MIPVGIGGDVGVSGTLMGARGKGGGGIGLEKEGALAISFNWQSGGDVRLGVVENESPTLQKEQVPATSRTRSRLREWMPARTAQDAVRRSYTSLWRLRLLLL